MILITIVNMDKNMAFNGTYQNYYLTRYLDFEHDL